MALTIESRDDPGVYEFYVGECMKWALKGFTKQERGAIRRQCEVEVQNRARQILIQAGTVTANTYYSLETLLRYAEKMPGSKLAFFISDGFRSDTGPRSPVGRDRPGRLTDEARRAGVVIYTIDARGLISGAPDSTGSTADRPRRQTPDRQPARDRRVAGRPERARRRHGRARAAQPEHLRPVRGRGSGGDFALLSHRVAAGSRRGEEREAAADRGERLQGRPDLTVRAARGFVSGGAPASVEAKGAAKSVQKPADVLRQALTEFYPRQALPLQLSLIDLDVPSSGTVLTTSVQAFTEGLSYGAQEKESAQLTIQGVGARRTGQAGCELQDGAEGQSACGR